MQSWRAVGCATATAADPEDSLLGRHYARRATGESTILRSPARPEAAPLVRRADPSASRTAAAPAAHHAPAPCDDGRWRRIAADLGLPFLEHVATAPLAATVDPPDPEVFVRADRLLIDGAVEPVLVAAPDPAVLALVVDLFRRHPDLRSRVAIAAPREIRRALIARFAPALGRRAVDAMRDRDPTLSAAYRPAIWQWVVVAVALLAWIAAAFDLLRAALLAWTAAFVAIGALRALVAEALPDVVDPPPLADRDLPRVAVLVPLYREAAVIGDLVAALARLDYPRDRLDIRCVVEADDVATVAAVAEAIAGTPIDMVVVPPSLPRTKPKALNFALLTVDADIVTVYDAEDRPDPDQLRKAAAAFAAGPPDLAVVQAALEIDHVDAARPWLVRQFELEYAMLFHGLLPWLAQHRLFLPLGGTSNHFRRAALRDVGGWDPHNVTEDADIAVRLRRAGWRAEVIASSTLEEAPIDWPAWRAQRVRWLKGWMQTWLVHMRRPWRFHREMGGWAAAAFHLTLAGQLASVFVFVPSLVVIAAEAAGLLPLFADRGFDGDLLLMSSLVAFAAGLAGSVVLADRVADRGSPARRRHPTRALDLLTMPAYWCLMSFAAYRALGELMLAPHRWNKTTHGRAPRASYAPDRDA